jgi:hypothetical protein
MTVRVDRIAISSAQRERLLPVLVAQVFLIFFQGFMIGPAVAAPRRGLRRIDLRRELPDARVYDPLRVRLPRGRSTRSRPCIAAPMRAAACATSVRPSSERRGWIDAEGERPPRRLEAAP